MLFRKNRPSKIVRPRAEHCISRRDIDPDALKVMRRLAGAGFDAYLVGGSVRDLLLKRRPKDFDVSTDAHPNEIRRLFRNCFLIGNRFRLAHIRFGDKVIETSTFRKTPQEGPIEGALPGSLYQHSDNTFGSPEEDAQRRDFTVNGLFYDIKSFAVIDYVDGLRDLERRELRTIGAPDIRFREDPVRMLRAVRFSARLDFTIDRAAMRAMRRHYNEILHASLPRLVEEMLRLFTYQSSEPAFRLLWQTRLMSVLLPEVHDYVEHSGRARSPLWQYLEALDSLPEAETSNGLRLAVLFFPLICERETEARKEGDEAQLRDLLHEVFDPVNSRLPIPRAMREHAIGIIRRQELFMRAEAEGSKGRQHARRKKSSRSFGPDFEGALQLRRIHLIATGADLSSLDEWEALRDSLPRSERDMPARPKRRRHPRKPPENDNESDSKPPSAASDAAEGDGAERPPRKRRRGGRRRRNSTKETPNDQPKHDSTH